MVSSRLSVLSVASEVFPLIKTGGLADVAGALPAALAPFDVDMRTLLPGYPAVIDASPEARVVADWPAWFGGPAVLRSASVEGLDLFVLDAPHLYARPGNPYVDANGRDWPDNAERFAALAATAARIGRGAVDGYVPGVIHAHDWQTALVPAYLKFAAPAVDAEARAPATVLTIHNLAFQGRFAVDALGRIELPTTAFTSDALEYFGDIGYLKAGILMADAITTVSPTYAREIRTPRGGMGMDAMLRWRGSAVHGIVNGIDTDVWNPATDAALAARYDVDDLDARIADKRAIESVFGLPADDGPLVCMITRLTEQKGIDLVIAALDSMVARGIRLVVLGTGDRAFEDALRDAQARYPARVAVKIAYDDALSHRMQAGCDAILIPSRFEPCGLTQLYGLRYGCVPVVARVGGLADTIVDANDAASKAGVATGFLFDIASDDGVLVALDRMIDAYARPEVWRGLQAAGMRADVSWSRSAEAFATLYRGLVADSSSMSTKR